MIVFISTVPLQFSSVTQSCPTLRSHGLQHARPPCPSPASRVYSNSCLLSRWGHPTIWSSVVPFSSHFSSFPASGSFQMNQFFPSGGQSIGVSASASLCQAAVQLGSNQPSPQWHPFAPNFFFSQLLKESYWHLRVTIDLKFYLFIYLTALGLSRGMWGLVPWPGIEPRLPALGAWSLDHQGNPPPDLLNALLWPISRSLPLHCCTFWDSHQSNLQDLSHHLFTKDCLCHTGWPQWCLFNWPWVSLSQVPFLLPPSFKKKYLFGCAKS